MLRVTSRLVSLLPQFMHATMDGHIHFFIYWEMTRRKTFFAGGRRLFISGLPSSTSLFVVGPVLPPIDFSMHVLHLSKQKRREKIFFIKT